MDLKLNPDYKPYRRENPHLKDMSFEERNRLIRINPDYGVIICRCEEVSKGEIIDALNSPIPVKSLDALKRRVRPGMGRCQGGFCTPLTMKIISQQCGVNMLSITKKGDRSNIVIGETKGKLDYNKGGDEVGNL